MDSISSVPFVLFCLVASIPYALTVNNRPGKARTTLCVIFPVLFGMFAWSYWDAWQRAAGSERLQPMLAFICACAVFVVTLAALGRRIWWLRRGEHPEA